MLTKSFYEQLGFICLRPKIFLGRKSILLLDVYLMGYEDFAKMHGIQEIYTETPNFYLFNQFVKDKYNSPLSTLNWASIIYYECNEDDELSFDTFCTLLSEFKSNHFASL